MLASTDRVYGTTSGPAEQSKLVSRYVPMRTDLLVLRGARYCVSVYCFVFPGTEVAAAHYHVLVLKLM